MSLIESSDYKTIRMSGTVVETSTNESIHTWELGRYAAKRKECGVVGLESSSSKSQILSLKPRF